MYVVQIFDCFRNLLSQHFSCPCLSICIYSIVSSPVAIISYSIMKKAGPTLKKAAPTLRKTTPASPRPSPYPSTSGNPIYKAGQIHRSDAGTTDPLTNTPSNIPAQSPTHQSSVSSQPTQLPAEDLPMVPPQTQLPTEPLPYPSLQPPSSQNSVTAMPATSSNGTVGNSGQPGPLPVDKGKAKVRSFLLGVKLMLNLE